MNYVANLHWFWETTLTAAVDYSQRGIDPWLNFVVFAVKQELLGTFDSTRFLKESQSNVGSTLIMGDGIEDRERFCARGTLTLGWGSLDLQ